MEEVAVILLYCGSHASAALFLLLDFYRKHPTTCKMTVWLPCNIVCNLLMAHNVCKITVLKNRKAGVYRLKSDELTLNCLL